MIFTGFDLQVICSNLHKVWSFSSSSFFIEKVSIGSLILARGGQFTRTRKTRARTRIARNSKTRSLHQVPTLKTQNYYGLFGFTTRVSEKPDMCRSAHHRPMLYMSLTLASLTPQPPLLAPPRDPDHARPQPLPSPSCDSPVAPAGLRRPPLSAPRPLRLQPSSAPRLLYIFLMTPPSLFRESLIVSLIRACRKKIK